MFAGDQVTIKNLVGKDEKQRYLAYLLFIDPTLNFSRFKEFNSKWSASDYSSGMEAIEVIDNILSDTSDATEAFAIFDSQWPPFLTFHLGELLF